jgi:hypothetical protein
MLDLNFAPGNYGIAPHLKRRSCVAHTSGVFGSGHIYLQPKWKKGDVSNEFRAAREAEAQLRERYDRPFLFCGIHWQSQAMRYDHGIFALEIPPDLSGFPYDHSRVMQIWGKYYLNPTPFRFRAEDVKTIEVISKKSKNPDAIDLIGLAQPLAFPATSSGLYYFLEVGWESVSIQINGVSAPRWITTIMIGAILIDQGYISGQEATARIKFGSAGASDLIGLLHPAKLRFALSRGVFEIEGDFPEGSSEYDEFTSAFPKFLFPLARSLKLGLLKFAVLPCDDIVFQE